MDTLFDSPRARSTDPETSVLAAAVTRAAEISLQTQIVRIVSACEPAPVTADFIADRIEWLNPRRWSRGTIVAAVSRSGLWVVDHDGESTRGRPCRRYRIA